MPPTRFVRHRLGHYRMFPHPKLGTSQSRNPCRCCADGLRLVAVQRVGFVQHDSLDAGLNLDAGASSEVYSSLGHSKNRHSQEGLRARQTILYSAAQWPDRWVQEGLRKYQEE